MDVNAPAQIITDPVQLITAVAQPPATGVAVFTAFTFKTSYIFRLKITRDRWTDGLNRRTDGHDFL